MKRLITLLILALSAFTFKVTAQTGTTCNAGFNFTVSAATTVQFVPVMAGDSVGTAIGHHSWYFGDGTPAATNINPVHVYANCGVYTVKHYFWKTTPNGVTICSDSATKVVTLQCPTSASCNAQFTNTISGNTAHFTPAMGVDSTPGIATIHTWIFGDGSNSNAVDPTHTYANCGSYSVKHIIKKYATPNTANPVCVDSVIKTLVIQCPTSCNIHAAYSFYRDSIQTNKVYFTNLSTPTSDVHFVKWTFGDGTTSTDYNAVHTYANSGAYTVCLEVKRDSAGTCKDDTCMIVQVQVPTACNLQANYYWFADSLQYNKIHFINTTVNIAPGDSIKWTFGDGMVSYDLNPIHIYSTPGTYTACLTIKRPTLAGSAPCASYTCKTIVVVTPCTLVADFTWQADPLHPTKIYFTNTSVPLSATDSIRWTFGDGSSSFDVNAVHTYNVAGIYTVCLRVKKNNPNTSAAPCVREICKTVVVSTPCNFTIDFSWHADSVQANKIHFTNLTSPLSSTDSIRWTFGDGSSSLDVNPTHLYANPGTYTVCLRVKKNNTVGTTPCVKETCKTITVTSPCNFQAIFTWHADSINHKKIYFLNQTIVPTATASANWSFGDGTTASGWNAVHEYAQPGRYYVCLRVESGPNCVRYTCDSITVSGNEPPCNDLAKFSMQAFSNDYLKYKFIPNYQNPSYLYVWSFGDGTGSNSMIAEHRYNQPGLYNVCLTVFRNNTCVSTVCKELRIYPQLNCDSIHVTYTSVRDAYVPNKYYFYAISNFPLLQQRWTFTRISPLPAPAAVVLYQNNPVYVFPDTGVYQVCLRAITLGGCVKEYCNTIHVEHVLSTNTCMLQAYPNPTSNEIHVNVVLTAPEMIHAYVYNALNVLVREKHQPGVIGNNVVAIDVASLVPGWYTIKLIYGNRTCYARFQKI